MFPRMVTGLGLILAAAVSPVTAAETVDAVALDAVPERIGYQPPRYPAELVAEGRAVDVTMTVIVDRDGSVAAMENVAAPQPAFAAAAREAVARWQFQPGVASGQPVRYRLPVTVPFRSETVNQKVDTTAADASGLMVVAEPTVEWEVAPAYPAELAADPRDGVAVVNLLVDAVGEPSDPVVEYASDPAFARAAADAVRSWRFNAAEHEGRLVATRTQVTVRFRKADAALTAADRKRRAQFDQAGSYDVGPEELIQVPLVYPYEALIRAERGTVSLNLVISPEGQVVTISPDPGSNTEFALAAGACVSCWTFRPATKHGEPVFGRVKWQLLFADNSGELQWDDASRELLAALRAGTFKPAGHRDLDRPLAPRERIGPRIPPGLGPAAVGDAVIEVLVDGNGRVQFPRVVSAPTPEIGYAAATAALRWRFEPPRSRGQPATVRVKIPFKFTLPEPTGEAGGGATTTP